MPGIVFQLKGHEAISTAEGLHQGFSILVMQLLSPTGIKTPNCCHPVAKQLASIMHSQPTQKQYIPNASVTVISAEEQSKTYFMKWRCWMK